MCRKLIYLISFVLVLGPAFSSIASGADPSLVGWWKLDDANGTTFVDSSSYGHSGTITNPDTNPVRWTDSGYKGRALNFTSKTNSPFTICDAPLTTGLLNTTEATLSFWMKMPTTPASWGPIIVLLNSTVNIDVEPGDGGNLFVNFQGGSIWFGASTTFNDNNWHHITVTFSSSNSKILLYGDGSQIASNATNSGVAITAVRLGGPRVLNQWRSYGGLLDEVAVFNRALSAAEVKNLFWYDPEWALYATNPSPADKATVNSTNVTLTWTPGTGAANHHVYFGDNFDNVKNGTGGTDKGLIAVANYETGTLVNGKTYYWRIDEVGAGGSPVYTGAVWRFTVAQKTAYNPAPADGAKLVDPNTILSWSAGMGAISHNVYFGTNPTNPPLVSNAQTTTTYDPSPAGILNYKTTYYWRVDEFNGTSTYTGPVWSFKTTPHIQITDPNLVGWYNFNEDEDHIVIDWSGSGNHSLQVNGQPLHVAGHDANAMQFDGVDDSVEVTRMVQNDFTLMAWIKTDTPGPEGSAGRDGSGLIWADYSGGGDHFIMSVLGTKLSFDTGAAPTTNTISNKDIVTGDWVHVAVTRTRSSGQIELFINATSDAAATHTTRELAGTTKIAIGANLFDSHYYAGLIDEVHIYNRVLTADEIGRIVASPQAWLPNPSNNSTNASPTPALIWKPGIKAKKHDVYLSDNWDDVNEAKSSDPCGPTMVYKGRQDPNSYGPVSLNKLAKTYYWRIDEVNDPNFWRGNIWRFTTRNYFVMDDFESYNNSVSNTWIKGGGGTVGYSDPNKEELTIVHGGNKSMPFDYNNINFTSSEATRTYAAAQDWTAEGVKSLTLWLRGYMAPVGSFTRSGSSPNYSYAMTASGTDINIPNWRFPSKMRDEFHYAYIQANYECDIIAKVDSVSNSDPEAKAGLMIRDSLADNSAYVMMCITPDPCNGIWYQYRPTAGQLQNSGRITQIGITAPRWLWLRREFNGSDYEWSGYYSADGSNWTPLVSDGNIPVTAHSSVDTVYIGLIVTARNAAAACTGIFSNVSVTDGGLGTTYNNWPTRANPVALPWPWPNTDIGIKSNNAAPLYVTLEDSTTAKKTVTHPDPNIVLSTSWQAWNIALSDFTGVDKTKIKKMTIGVARNSFPVGTLYFDDIRLYIPRCIPGIIPDPTSSNCLIEYYNLGILTNNWLISNYQVTPAAPSDTNLVAYYNFNGNFNDSAGGHNGEPNGALIINDLIRGQVANFDGINDYVSLPIGPDINSMSSATFATWVNFSNNSNLWQRIFDFGTGTTYYMFLTPRCGAPAPTDRIRFAITTGGNAAGAESQLNAPSALATGWHHIAVVINGANMTIQLYLDGTVVANGPTQTLPSNLGDTTQNWLGRSQWAGDAYFTGYLDDFRIYNRALSPGEIASLAGKTASFTQPLYLLLTPQNQGINLYNDGRIDLKDYAVLANLWLEELLWP